jgi:hypothetical protein
MCQKLLRAAVEKSFISRPRVQSPESSSEGKGVRTKILLLFSEVAEVGHFACKHSNAVVYMAVR